MHKVFAKSIRDILEDIYHKIRRYGDSQKRENSGFQARRLDQSATLPPLTNRLKWICLPWTRIVPLVAAFPATDSTRHVYVPASISCTVVILSDPSACTVIRAVSTGEPSLVQVHLTVTAGSFCTAHWRVFGSPFVAWIWLGNGVVITVLTATNTHKKCFSQNTFMTQKSRARRCGLKTWLIITVIHTT